MGFEGVGGGRTALTQLCRLWLSNEHRQEVFTLQFLWGREGVGAESK